jgi:peroxiredoxin
MLGKTPIVLLLAAAASSFQLRDTQGALHAQAEWAAHKAIVLFFVTTDCPVGNSYVPEMNRIHDAYTPRGVAFYAVQADPSVREPDVVKYAKDYGYSFPLLLDPSQILVRRTGATITPQAAILTPDGRLQYLGPIDDRFVDFGKSRPRATASYLRSGLDDILAGKAIAVASRHSLGCSIPRNQK